MPILPLLLAEAVSVMSRPHLRAERAASAPVLDGNLGDEAWKNAAGSSEFTQVYPHEGKPAAQRTTVRVLYDNDNLYVGIDCDQPTSPIVARLTRRDRDSEADYVVISLDSKRSGTSAYEFGVNAAGVLRDRLRFNDTEASDDWDEVWDARTSVRDHGWSAEFRIPLRILRFDSLPEQSWGLQAVRYISALQETDHWAYIPRSSAGVVSHYGHLDNLVSLQPTTSPLELVPFLVGRIRRQDPTKMLLSNGYSASGSVGGDIKWHPTPQLTLQASFNPDFAQVEADQDILNLTTFETYYPEKRPFFLEGLDAFQTPYQLLYTRRVGRAAPSPTLATGEMLVDLTQPATIYGAAKLTGKLGEAWSVGTLQALTGTNGVQVQLADGVRQNRTVAPLSLFNVVRVKREVGANAHLGFMATSLTRAEAASSYGMYPASPLSPSEVVCATGGVQTNRGARCFNDAYVGAFDGRWRSPGGDYSATAQAAASLLQGGPIRSVLDGTKIASGDLGAGAQMTLSKDGGDHWIGNIYADYQTPRFTYDDVGFMQRANLATVSGVLAYRTLTPWGETLGTRTRLTALAQDNAYGLNLGREIHLNFIADLRNFWSLNIGSAYASERYDDREVGNGTALQRAANFGTGFTLASDPTKPVASTMWAYYYRFVAIGDANYVNVGADLVFRAHPQLDLEVSPVSEYTSGEPRSISQLTANGNPMFGRQHAPNTSTILRATYTFMPRLTLQAYAQLFLASVHFSDFSYAAVSGPHAAVRISDLKYGVMAPSSNPDYVESALNVNVVLRWEYKLGSVAYLVYQRYQVPNVSLNPGEAASINLSSVGHRAAATDAVVLKISYWWS